jgi:asparagine synthase (glutamine-hydrolysing)
MEKFWGRFVFNRNNKAYKENSEKETSLYLPNGELHWQKDSPFVLTKQRPGLLIFKWGSIRSRTELISQDLILVDLADALINSKSPHLFLKEIEGEFALVIWNENEGKLYLATDPFGITKLYYRVSGNTVVFSSHANVVAKICNHHNYSPEGISTLLSLKGIPAPYTVIDGVFVLEPAEMLEINSRGKEHTNYWSIIDSVDHSYSSSFEQSQLDFINLLKDSLTRISHTRDKPIGVCLSSGIDSALLLGINQKIGVPSIAYSVGYNPPGNSDETEEARQNAEAIGVKVEVLKPTDAELASLLDIAVLSMPEPISDASLLPQLYLTLAAKHHVSAILDGTGADNLFGGLQKFRAEMLLSKYHRIPKFLRRGFIRPFLNLIPSSRKSKITNWARKAQKFAERAELPEEIRKISWSRFLTQRQVNLILPAEWHGSTRLAEKILLGKINESRENISDLFTTTYASIRVTLPNHSLQKLMTLQYISAVEYALPYITPEMVEFGLQLPDHYKLTEKQSKLVLRSAAEKILPPICLNREKANFSPPIDRWLKGVFREELLDTLRSDGPFDRKQIEKMLSQQMIGWRDWQWELWIIFIVLKWWKKIKE